MDRLSFSAQTKKSSPNGLLFSFDTMTRTSDPELPPLRGSGGIQKFACLLWTLQGNYYLCGPLSKFYSYLSKHLQL